LFIRSLSALPERVCFLFVDKYEPDSSVANLLKFSLLVVGAAAILHKLRPFGLELF
jgi:hypothetical protein